MNSVFFFVRALKFLLFMISSIFLYILHMFQLLQFYLMRYFYFLFHLLFSAFRFSFGPTLAGPCTRADIQIHI